MGNKGSTGLPAPDLNVSSPGLPCKKLGGF